MWRRWGFVLCRMKPGCMYERWQFIRLGWGLGSHIIAALYQRDGERDLWNEMWLERQTGAWERRLIGSYLSVQPTADGWGKSVIISDGRGVAILEPTSSGNAVLPPAAVIIIDSWHKTSLLGKKYTRAGNWLQIRLKQIRADILNKITGNNGMSIFAEKSLKWI